MKYLHTILAVIQFFPSFIFCVDFISPASNGGVHFNKYFDVTIAIMIILQLNYK